MPDLAQEDRLRQQGHSVIAGLDEAGRGPLAGPVYAAAVILPTGYAHEVLNDSKKLSAAVRERLYQEITADPAIIWCSARAEVEEIDRLNILKATHLAMRRAAEGLTISPEIALIDGLAITGFPWPQVALVGGDGLSLSIAAASIIAKVERDRFMVDMAKTYPDYGFELHKGYGTAKHLESLRKHGPCPLHRRTFAPVAQQTFDFGV